VEETVEYHTKRTIVHRNVLCTEYFLQYSALNFVQCSAHKHNNNNKTLHIPEEITGYYIFRNQFTYEKSDIRWSKSMAPVTPAIIARTPKTCMNYTKVYNSYSDQ
jgi:hypothetical protein